jgi:hypothetical protein
MLHGRKRLGVLRDVHNVVRVQFQKKALGGLSGRFGLDLEDSYDLNVLECFSI